MIVNKLLSFSVILVLLVNFKLSVTQDAATETTTEAASNLICSQCACADGVVNCVNLNVTSTFELSDWDGLQEFKPTTVDLSQNPITMVTRFSKLPIQVLNISNCGISTIEEASFIYLEDLTTLDLSRNKISTSAFTKRTLIGPLDQDKGPQEFKKIQYLSLAFNDIHSLPQDVFMFISGLHYLDLSGNPLAYIDQVTMGAISDLNSLRELRLSGCELETLPDGLLRRQRKLQRLDLSDNRFTTIPVVLQEASNLVYLNLDKISLQTLEANNAISNLTKLRELHMSRLSRLQNITAGALGRLTNLEVLRLNYNPRLTTLDPDFLVWKDEDDEDDWPTLKELYLNNNNLSTIDSGILDGWNDLVAADFSNNPYNCDCNNQWMVDVLVPLLNNMPTNATTTIMVCKKPADVRGLTFAQLNNASKTLVCPENESIIELPEANMVILLGIMIGIMVTFPLVLILVLLWRRGFFTRFQTKKMYDEDETEDL